MNFQTHGQNHNQEKSLRLFLALELPTHLRVALAKVITALKKYDQRAIKWVDPDNVHLTVKFLGQTPDDKVEQIKSTITSALSENSDLSEPFSLISDKLGAFPNLDRPNVFWASCAGADYERLGEFAQTVDTALSNLGFEKEKRPFKPHLTLGRVRRPQRGAKSSDLTELTDALRNYGYTTVEFTLEKLILFKSELTPEGPIYTELGSWDLRVERFG